jgi:hypothetical protein
MPLIEAREPQEDGDVKPADGIKSVEVAITYYPLVI